LAASNILWRTRLAQLGLAPLLVRGSRTTHASMRREEKRLGAASTRKMLKMKIDPEMYMKKKGPQDTLPDAKDDISARLRAILHKHADILATADPFAIFLRRLHGSPSHFPL
jgi:hypothetical protein